MKKIAIKKVDSFTLLWNDKKSGGRYNGAFYKPNVPDGYYSVGDYGQNNYNFPSECVIVIRPLEDGIIKNPIDYELIWADHSSGSSMDGSFWLPIPPAGYQALGTVCQSGYDKPSLDRVVCVKQDLLVPGKVGDLIWDDEKTGADKDFGAWKIVGNSDDAIICNTFLGVPSHSKPTASNLLNCLNANMVDITHPETQKELGILIQKFAPILYFNEKESYLMTCVEKFLDGSNLVNNETKESKQATLENLPAGKENEEKYHLELHDQSVRSGDLQSAKAYVHAKISENIYLDIQYWFLYGYNGPGTARVKSLAFETTVHAGNSSLAPLGEHEGDWEHITVRISLLSNWIESVYFSQHSGGQWVPTSNLKFSNDRLIVYSSLNGHATYPNIGINYTEHRKYPDPAIPAGLEFFLVNETNEGKNIDCRSSYELVSAEFLNDGEKPIEPNWVNFLNRWGKSNSAHLTPEAVQGVLDSAIGVFGKVFGFETLVGLVLKEILPLFVKENQDGPTGLKAKSSWLGTE